MDSIKITKIEESKAVTITSEEYDSLVIEVISEMSEESSGKIPDPVRMIESLVSSRFACKLYRKLFKEN